jgi:small subunit ribosomal protein S14
MAKACSFAKFQTQLKFSARARSRCERCGRTRAVYQKFSLCRVCFRDLSLKGEIPGVIKASW